MKERSHGPGGSSRRAIALALCACLGGALMAGCGGSSGGGGSSTPSGSSAPGSTSTSAGGTAPKTATGDGTQELCVTSLVSFGLAPVFFEGYKQIATDLKMKYVQKIASPDGNLQSAASNIEQCIQSKATAIVGIATENAAVAAQIAQAAKAGIPYIADESGSPVPGVKATIWGNEWENSAKLVGYLLTNYTTPRKVLVLKATVLPVVRRRTTGFLAAAAVEKGQIQVEATAELDLAAGVANSATDKVTAALRANKDINVVVAPWDDPAAGAVAALKRLGRDDVAVLSYDGLEPTYAAMRTGQSPIAALAALPSEALFNVRKAVVGQILAKSLPDSVNALCTGPLVTKDNVPGKGSLTPGGECIVSGKVVSAATLKQQAAG
ncbi:MAG: ribose transport system substrate-binding protein [Solirubrobacteraceae bacterium]|nr:ribose transport system substrate-binding protein [Solirubrobacteraceae bacterium]MEA2277752.1 ribose transport system substrate-binding protein [Solirubrobacteraceae bacterium]MEA2358654.1 ribose transport system substrate-binding protein [Solirubrobacteraceae bacterium]